MVWGGRCRNGRTDLIIVRGTLTAVRYSDEIIVPVVVPFVQQRNGMIFQQDNARPHTAIHTKGVFRANNIQLLDRPSRSPDLSPIEHLWDVLGRRVRKRNDVNNVRNLERALHEEWVAVPD